VAVPAGESFHGEMAYGSGPAAAVCVPLLPATGARFLAELQQRHPSLPGLPELESGHPPHSGGSTGTSSPPVLNEPPVTAGAAAVVSDSAGPVVPAAAAPESGPAADVVPKIAAPVPPLERLARVLILNTGGTISMKPSPEGYVPDPFFVRSFLRRVPQLSDPNYPLDGLSLTGFVTPVSEFGHRIYYELLEYDPLLDSSNMDQQHWTRIARDIEHFYADFDGFVVMHGTDTMCYTASALSFMFTALAKTVVFTGAQVPMSAQRSDGVSNLLGALMIAGHYVIPEVCVFFNNHLYRGNRCSKISSTTFDGFSSPNFPPLVHLGVRITVAWDSVFHHGSVR
jgi:hypothetical protein